VLKDRPQIPMVAYYEKVDEERLRVLQNQCMFHIYPSGTEGFGHALHEALSVGAMVLTTGRPPMCEIEGAYYLGANKKTIYNLADVWEVDALEIFDAVQCVTKMSMKDIKRRGMRQQFLLGNIDFKNEFAKQLTDVRSCTSGVSHHVKGETLRIAFLGNFLPEDSTENMVKWALTQGLGVEVEPLQESEVNLVTLEEAADWNDVFLWVRTPNYLQVTDGHMKDFLQRLRERKIPSISLHLDKFWGIREREEQIGNDAFWKSEFVFTADGSSQEKFKQRGVNHYWMQPAVSEVYCHPGVPRDEFKCDVGFVGAQHYHQEYPFRPQMVNFLKENFGDRFKHIFTLRGHGLNDFYASCKVVVGDCIFAGTPYYWSDRLPETCGRYGFLLHPEILGLDKGVPTYVPQSLDSLLYKIDLWLTYEKERQLVRKYCTNRTILHDTWTVRMGEILHEVLQKELREGEHGRIEV